MEFIRRLVDTLIHLSPQKLNDFISYVGVERLYMVVFVIVFMETGFVVTPFLPGDSLLFALGAVAASPDSPVKLPLLAIILCLAANSGDLVNYTLGKKIGPKVFSAESSRLLNKKHLISAQEFYEKHGRKTIILARFVPIIRTFAPFVAGIGRMNFFRFASFSVVGGIIWVVSLTLAGYWFGSQEQVKRNFHLVIVAIIVISVLPVVFEFLKARRRGSKAPLDRPTHPVEHD
jgi:membrane-associated protein